MFKKIWTAIKKFFAEPQTTWSVTLTDRLDLHPCVQCQYGVQGEPCNRCTHPQSGLLLVPHDYWVYDRPSFCPLIKNEVKD